MTPNPFDHLADRYDHWFETEQGGPIFTAEIQCIDTLTGPVSGRWLEVGVGTGRFAEALGIRDGVDPSTSVLMYAARRGVRVARGVGEALPYRTEVFDGVLMVVTICFLRDALAGVVEASRVLRPGGVFITGLVPADSPWGRMYREKSRRGHPFYSVARFYTVEEVVAFARTAGLEFEAAAGALFGAPGGPPPSGGYAVHAGWHPESGFTALLFRKQDAGR